MGKAIDEVPPDAPAAQTPPAPPAPTVIVYVPVVNPDTAEPLSGLGP